MNDTRPNDEQRESLWTKAQQSGMTRRRFLSLLGTGGAAAVLAACGSQTAAPSKDTPKDTPAAAATPKGTPAPTATPKPTRGKEINVALDTFGTDILDPIMMTSSAVKNLMEPMYDAFINVEPDAELSPGVFTSWKVSSDHLTWTFEMRKGIKFHGGLGEATIEDAKFSIERYLLPEAVYKSNWAAICDKVEIAGPTTLNIKTKRPEASMPALLSSSAGTPAFYLMPKKFIEEKGVEAYRKAPIGSGRYQFKSYTAGSTLEFSAFDDHWAGPAGYDTYRAMLVPQENARIGLLRQGRAQVAIISPDGARDVKAAGLDVLWVQGIAQAQVVFFGTYHDAAQGKPAADKRVRQALSYAINRQELIDALLPGGEMPCMPGATDMIAYVDHAKWKKVAKETYTYDVAKAKRLLAEAGYPNGFEYILYTYPLSAVPTATVAEAVAGYWEKVGIKVKLIPTDQAVFQPWRAQNPLPPQLLAQASTFRSTASSPQLYQTMKSLIYAKGNILRLLNTGLTTSGVPELDDLIEAAGAEFDTTKLGQINDQILTKLADTWAVLPVASVAAPFGADPNVAIRLRPNSFIAPSLIDARPKK